VRVRATRWLGFAGSAAALCAACGSRSGLYGELGVDLPVRPNSAFPGDTDSEELPRLATDGPTFGAQPALPPPGCVDFVRNYTSLPATVLMLIDQSGSMNVPFGDSTRWDVLRTAIIDPQRGLLQRLPADTRVGMTFYTSFRGFAGGTCPVLASSVIATGSYEAITSLYQDTEPAPAGDTPTGDAIDAASAVLSQDSGRGPRYILLLTDGVPDTCAQPNPQFGLDEAVDAAARAYQRGVRVVTVGVSDSLAGWALQQMANAGAGKASGLVFGQDPGAERPLSAASDPATLAGQLAGLIGDVRTCLVDLGQDVFVAQGGLGSFELDGRTLSYRGADGWSFRDGRTVEIHGAACDRILGTGEQLKVRFPCDPELR
jgi:hypothetical protein